MKRIKINVGECKISLLSNVGLQELASDAIRKKAKYIDLIGLSLKDLYNIYDALTVKWNLSLAGYELVKRELLRNLPTGHPAKKDNCAICGRSYQKIYAHKEKAHRIYSLGNYKHSIKKLSSNKGKNK